MTDLHRKETVCGRGRRQEWKKGKNTGHTKIATFRKGNDVRVPRPSEALVVVFIASGVPDFGAVVAAG